MTVLLTGIIAAFFIGFSLKALFNPVRLTEKVAQAAGRVHKEVSVSFDSARMSLADGIFPDLAVVITNVRVSSEKACWGRPEIFMDEVRLPISLISWLRAQVPVRKVDIHEMILNVRSAPSKCEGEVRLQPSVSVQEISSAEIAADERQEESLLGSLQAPPSAMKKNPIDRVNIFSLRVNYIPEPRYKAQFDSLRIRAKSHEPRQFVLDAKTHLFKDELVGDFLSYANIHAEYSEHPDQRLMVHFFGNLREGYYSFIGNYSFADHLMNFETELKHIPLAAILGLSQKITGKSAPVQPKKLWLSLKAQTAGQLEALRQSPLIIRDVKLEGDLLELKTDLFEIHSIDPFLHKPVSLSVKSLSLNELFHIYRKKLPSRSFGNLGFFSGKAEIKNAKNIHLNGVLSQMELNFSNRGEMRTQTVERMNGQISFVDDFWKFRLDRVELRDGVLAGSLNVRADRDFKDIEIDSEAEELILARDVQKLMTLGGEIQPLKASIKVKMSEGKIQNLSGLVRSQGAKIEGLQLGASEFQMGYERQRVIIHSRLQNLDISENSVAYPLVSSLLSSPPENKSQGLQLKDFKGRFEVLSPQELIWVGVQGKLQDKMTLALDGGWSNQGKVFGRVILRNAALNDKKIKAGDKKTRSFRLQGTREEPQLVQEK